MAELFEVNAHTYRAGKLNAFQQLHVSRRIAPLLPKLLPAYLSAEGNADGALDLAAFASAVGPLADAIAQMSDADCEYVFGTCLSVVSRQQGTLWSPVWNGPSKSLMFEDIDLPAMTQIVVKVLGENLGPFTQGLLARAQAGSPTPA